MSKTRDVQIVGFYLSYSSELVSQHMNTVAQSSSRLHLHRQSVPGGGELGARLILWIVYEDFLLLVAVVQLGLKEDIT